MPNASPQLLAQVQDIGVVSGIGRFFQAPTAGEAAAAYTTTQIDDIFTMMVTFLTIVAGLTFLIFFILGGLNWITAGGDAKKVDTAKSYLTNGAIGMIVVVASYSIIWIVGTVLGLDILNPGNSIQTLFYSTN